jgi:DNA-directed RNA polymerase specialized sigma24 family protein
MPERCPGRVAANEPAHASAGLLSSAMADSELPALDQGTPELEAQVKRHAARVRAAAARYHFPPPDVDEVFQEVRIRLWKALKDGGPIAEAPASDVYRTALSATVDLIRRRRPRREETLDPVEDGSGRLMRISLGH